jgi:hypothetical protein
MLSNQVAKENIRNYSKLNFLQSKTIHFLEKKIQLRDLAVIKNFMKL